MHYKLRGCITYGKFCIRAAGVQLVNSCNAVALRGMVCCKKGMVSRFVDFVLQTEENRVPFKKLDLFASSAEMPGCACSSMSNLRMVTDSVP